MNNVPHPARPFIRWAYRKLVDFVRVLGKKSLRLGAPVGFYSVLEKPEDVSLVLERQESTSVSPDCLRIRCRFEQHNSQPWPIFWKKISPCRLVGPSLAVMNEEKKLMLESVYGHMHGPKDPSYKYLWLPPAKHLSGSWTSLISRWVPVNNRNYCHWLIDALPRLALLDRFPSDVGILTVAHLTPFQRESLEILGVIDRCRPTPETHLVLENYYFSSFTSISGCDNPYAIQFLRSKFLSAASSNTPRPEKIYITRVGSARSAYGEEKMEAFLQKEGWTIVRTQDYSFREQIALFSNARAVCGIHGAGMTNVLWCPEGCKVLELCPANFLNGCYESMATYLNLDYRYLVFEADSNYRMKVDLPQFTSAIKAMDPAPVAP